MEIFRVLLLCCVFTPVCLLQNQNHHVTLKLDFPLYNDFQLVYLVGTRSVALLFTLRQTFIDPTAGNFAEAKDIKRQSKRFRESSTQWIIYSCKLYFLFWERKYAGGICSDLSNRAHPLLHCLHVFFVRFPANRTTQMGSLEPDDIHLQFEAPTFRRCFLQAAQSSNENTSTKWRRGQTIQHPG